MDSLPGELDYGAEDYRGAKKIQHQGSGAILALAEEELMGEDDEYEDLYNDVNVGEGIFQFHRTEPPGSSSAFGNSGLQAQTSSTPEPRREVDVPRDLGNAGVPMDRKYQNAGASFPDQKREFLAVQGSGGGSVNHLGASSVEKGIHEPPPGNVGLPAPTPMGQNSNFDIGGRVVNPGNGVSTTVPNILNNQIAASINEGVNHTGHSDNFVRPPMENGSTILFVGELHWWTTDAELEDVLSPYGKVKEIKFFDERVSGKSKGYCQVEFYDPAAAAACKERMNGHVFNGRACVVAFASPQTLKQMGDAYANKTQTQPQSQPQGRRGTNDGVGRGSGMNYTVGDTGRNYGRGSWGRGGQAAFNRGPGASGPRGRGQLATKNSNINPAGFGNGAGPGNYGQGLHSPAAFGGPGNGMMHPQTLMGPGFDPTFMGRGAGCGSFSSPAFPGMMLPFPAVNAMGIPGVAPHVNPAFFGRGMVPNGMGMLGASGMDGHPGLMWGNPSMGGWAGEEHGQRTRESSYGGADGAFDYGHGDANTSREKERSSQRDWPGNSERRNHDENEQDRDRSQGSHRYREGKDGYQDHRSKDRELGYDDEWDRGISSSRSRNRSRAMPENDHRSRSRDADYGKRRCIPE